MGRRSTTGLPYLVLLRETGKYTYQRDLGSALVPLLSGEVRLAWSTKVVRLETGRATVKISLSTGDERMARTRWNDVHQQVDALIALAQIAANTAAQREAAKPRREPLPPGAITTIAGQAKHDLLAGHDETWIDPTFMSPLANVVARVLREQSFGQSERERAEAARRFETDLLLRQTREAIAAREPGWLDRTIGVTEVDPALFDVDGLRTGEVTATTPEQMKQLLGAKVTSVIPSEIDLRLTENGLGLPVGDPERRKLALALLRAKSSGLGVIRNREEGAAIETPPRPPISQQAPAPAPKQAVPTLSAMRDRWRSNKKAGDKQVADNALYIGYFISCFGDLPVTEIDRPKIDKFLMLLDRCCRNVPHHVRGASLEERVAWSERIENIGEPRLKRGTINAKGLGSLSAALSQAVRLGFIVVNPCTGMGLDVGKDEAVKRVPYTLEDLRNIFLSSIYAHPPEIPKAGRGAAAFWLPLLAMFTGARLEELGQLLLSDVKSLDGIRFLHITDVPDADEEATQGGNRTAKSLKSSSARRRVPIHPELISLGFLAFVEHRKRQGFTRLFPELEVYRERVTKEWSKWWGRFADREVTKAPDKSFHSFRHLFIATLRAAGVPEEQIKALVGHASTDVTIGYGNEDAFPLAVLSDAVKRMSVAGLDLSVLRWQEG